jgi:hypothetical protein
MDLSGIEAFLPTPTLEYDASHPVAEVGGDQNEASEQNEASYASFQELPPSPWPKSPERLRKRCAKELEKLRIINEG